MDELRTALNSCLAQKTAQPCEVLVINDGSDDGTEQMLSSDYPGVRVINHKESAGLVQRRNEGTFAAKGSIVFSIDDDAEFTCPDIVEHTLREFTNSCIAAVAIPFCNVYQGPKIFQKSPDESEIYITAAFRGTAYAIRRDVFSQVGGYRPFFIHQGEEGDLCLRMFELGCYVRLGSSNIINHFESPKRSHARMDFFGRRNDILSTYLNTPSRHLALQLSGTVVNGLKQGFKVRRVSNMVRGLAAGVKVSVEHHRNRVAVSEKAYIAYRKLKKSGHLALKEVLDG
jgi:GT2 family glycosyltransferase